MTISLAEYNELLYAHEHAVSAVEDLYEIFSRSQDVDDWLEWREAKAQLEELDAALEAIVDEPPF